MGRLLRTIHIDRKTESLWQKGDAVVDGTRRVWSIMSYWNQAKQLILNVTNNNYPFEPFAVCRIPKKVTQCHFSSWQCSITYGKTSSWHVGSTQLRRSTPWSVLTRLGFFRLPLVCFDAEQRFGIVRRFNKMAPWIFRDKKRRFKLAWDSQIDVKIGRVFN